MKIGIDLRTLISGNFSGIPGFTYELTKTILENDTQNEYFGFYNSYKKKKLPNLGSINVSELNIPNKILNPMMSIFRYPKIDKILNTEVLYMPHFNFNACTEDSFKVITVHDLSFVRYPEFFSFKNNLWHKLIQIKKTLKKFDKIVAISKNTKKDLIELFNVPEEKIEVVYSGVSDKYRVLDKESQELRDVKLKHALPNNFILSLGTIEPRKNIDSLIRAFDIFKEGDSTECHLVIAGGLGWKYKKTLEKLKKAKHKKYIKLLGFVDEDDKTALYNLASVFAFPSYYEGFGFPPLEAMKCGTPTIVSANSSLFEVVDNSSYLINPYDINDLARALKELLSNSALRNDFTSSGLANVKQFNWGNTANKYLEVFSKK
ncbi:hypothetical protein C0584_00055 [Candidatus Parcubacteria bacterium]|nr:MAG: hypothetical protein C0584_00055 [Candidatus Parcubacteria bacterium]